QWHIQSVGTLFLGILMAGPVYWATGSIATSSWWALLLKLSLATVGVTLAFALMGELSRRERKWFGVEAVALLRAFRRPLAAENVR
ncbi:MAG: hypothetical protein LH624_12540, partial [Cryobacterium sp.]|nr:hypothetical protein [Cryobacterium sp.]